MDDFARAAGRIWGDPAIGRTFRSLCALGGRYAGTPSEAAAREFLALRLAEATGAVVRRERVAYRGWDRGPARVTLASGQSFPASGLGRSPSTPPGGLTAPVVDLGRGTPADFTLAAPRIPGRIVMVRHEFMMGSGHIHRRRKYETAKVAGAAGFLIACHLPGGLLVTGSSGAGTERDIPGAGISAEAAGAISAAPEDAVTLTVEGRFEARVAENLLADIPGRGDESIVLSAHIDGHDLAASAIDNGSGLVAALAAATALRPLVPRLRRGLRVALFNVEEWALIGSREHLAALPEAERRRLAFNVNLDSVAGGGRLAVMTSGIASAEAIVDRVNAAHGFNLPRHRPFMSNSDHANFIEAGIPALRLCAGLDQPDSNARFLLTPGDTPEKVDPLELKSAATIAAALVLAAAESDIDRLGEAEIRRIVAAI